MTTPTAARAAASELLLTTDQLAERLQVPVATVRIWRHRGTGPNGFRLGRHVRYCAADVEAWIDERARAQA